jgi:C4-dicarboxylate-specific signal transduction histidine kinase
MGISLKAKLMVGFLIVVIIFGIIATVIGVRLIGGTIVKQAQEKVRMDLNSACGISPENLDKVFDPFFTTKDASKGTGLGLAVAYGVIEKHQGKIRMESEVGKGTTCVIDLPVNASE